MILPKFDKPSKKKISKVLYQTARSGITNQQLKRDFENEDIVNKEETVSMKDIMNT